MPWLVGRRSGAEKELGGAYLYVGLAGREARVSLSWMSWDAERLCMFVTAGKEVVRSGRLWWILRTICAGKDIVRSMRGFYMLMTARGIGVHSHVAHVDSALSDGRKS